MMLLRRWRRLPPVLKRTLLAMLAGVLLLFAAVAVATRIVPLPAGLWSSDLATTTLVDVRGERLAIIPSGEARVCEPISLAAMGRWLPMATVALEDHRFYQHHGIDWHSLVAAAARDLRTGRIVSGGSTITQQLIKITTHRTGRHWFAKVYEYLAAVRLERVWTKDHILEEYLNRSHFGNRLYGPAAAADRYFHKTAAKLTLTEAVYLAGLPQAPSRFNPLRDPHAAQVRYHHAIARLAALHRLNADQLSHAQLLPHLNPVPPLERVAPHFVEAVLHSHAPLHGGVVETTLDLALQRRVESALEHHLTGLAGYQVSQGAAVILDARTGAVRAMVGSRASSTRTSADINGTTEYRSCGSTLKPFLYLHAIDERLFTAATLLPDTSDATRAQYVDYDPVDYDHRFLGPVRVREALANSLNVPAVVTLGRLGARKTFQMLQHDGIRFAGRFDDYGAGLILGNAEIRLIDLTAAFTLFAGHKVAVDARLLNDTPVRHRYLAAPDSAAIISDILADNTARQKTFGPFSPLAFEDYRIPCKTGTSSGFRDGWTVGVTREHSVGVWVGNFDGHPMKEVAAIVGAAPIWREIIEFLLREGDTSVPAPSQAGGLVQTDVCQLTGLLPSSDSPSIIHEWFLSGTEPQTDASDWFRRDASATHLVLPPEYAMWCRSSQNFLDAQIRSDTRLRIVSPHPDATFVIDPHLPPSKQAIALVAVDSSGVDLLWCVDGVPLPAETTEPRLWRLVPGRHTVEVTHAGEHATAQFTVK